MRSKPRVLLCALTGTLFLLAPAAAADGPLQGLGPAGGDAPGGVVTYDGPTIEILSVANPGSNSCDTTGGFSNPLFNVYVSGFDDGDHDCYEATIPGLGVVTNPFCEFIGGTPDGNYIYGVVLDNPYSVPAGTPITVEIRSFDGGASSGRLNHISRIVFACDTGAVSSLTNEHFGSLQEIPTLGAVGFAALALALVGLALWTLRRRAVAS